MLSKFLTALQWRGAHRAGEGFRTLMDSLQIDDAGWCFRTGPSGRIELRKTIKAVESGYDCDILSAMGEGTIKHIAQRVRAFFLKSVPLGGAYLLRKLWEQLGLEKALAQSLEKRDFLAPIEWALFAMVANRALAPDSKRGVEEWVREDVALGNPEPISLQHLYRAMDFLQEHGEEIQKEVFFATADLFRLEVDLLFFDTTSTYVERDEEDEGGLKRYGHSKDHRPDRPQIVIGLAGTKEGIPVRCWVLPGNTQDMTMVERVKKDLAGWKLSRCIWVMDRGMNSAENRTILQQAGGHYILGEKLRDEQGVHQEALARRG